MMMMNLWPLNPIRNRNRPFHRAEQVAEQVVEQAAEQVVALAQAATQAAVGWEVVVVAVVAVVADEGLARKPCAQQPLRSRSLSQPPPRLVMSGKTQRKKSLSLRLWEPRPPRRRKGSTG